MFMLCTSPDLDGNGMFHGMFVYGTPKNGKNSEK